MNFMVFCNISRHLIRNFYILKLQQNSPAARTLYKNKKAFGNYSKQVWRVGTIALPCNEGDFNRNDGHHGKGSKENKSRWEHYFGPAGMVVSGAFSFNFFGKSEEEETPEDKLINTIKRSILCIQKSEYDKAEKMLHLALRMAQDLQSKEGITYIYDVMANLAMEREQFKKAEKLFADVMKRLFAEGYSEDSPQILHISAKLAHMSQLQGELDKSLQGFTWTMKRIEEHIRKAPNDKELQELLGLVKNWFGQLQMKLVKYAEAKRLFQEAYDCLTEIYGRVNQEAVTILNNLSVACVNLDDFTLAKQYLQEALDLVRELKDSTQEGIIMANLGLVYLREGLTMQAKETCSSAYRIGKKDNNHDAIEQAEYCLNEIKTSTQ